MSALPKLKSPTFTYTLPLSKKKIHYRPYTVKEEKILLIAMQSGEMEDIITAIKQVVKNCIQEKIDPGTLSTFDLEVIQILLRIVSTSNEVVLSYNDNEDNSAKPYVFKINLQELLDDNIKNMKLPNKEIPLSNEYSVSMKDITIDMFMNRDLEDLDDPVKMYDVLGRTIEKVYSSKNEDEVYFLKDFNSEEIAEFVDSFDKKASENLAEYFKNLPAITKTLTWTNTKGTLREIKLSGVTDFFQ